MATGSIPLAIGAAILPDGSASNAAPAMQRVKSSATAPAPYFLQLAYDAATREQVTWSLRMPADYGSTPTLKIQCKTAATSGNTIFEGRLAAVTPGDATDVTAKAFAAANTSSATAVPSTAQRLFEISIALTSADSLAAGDLVIVYLARDAANASDTVNGNDIEVVAATLEYTTA
ncbi:hypothetical protein ACFYUV_38070 [Nonomuraea sp. NPDC003560]|uniref:hypothetical protein n=1 Tax=Nonomuraea sp. NPDC003560 TaxID=3364341 RepID=UPI00367A3621